MVILKAVLWFSLLGLAFGVLLAIASKVFYVKTDERVEKMKEILPGANCGGCGYAGCSAYAEAVAKGEAKIGLCNAGGAKVASFMEEVMGVKAENTVKMRAIVACMGDNANTKKKYIYNGASDCVSAFSMSGGDRECQFGCIGLGSCASVCRFGAIILENGKATVIREKCTGCGACIRICPKKIIKLIPYDAKYTVLCSSLDKGNITRAYCNVGCIGCHMCEKQCEVGAVVVDGALAHIDPDKCVGCGKCASKCPRKIIILTNGRATVSANATETVKNI